MHIVKPCLLSFTYYVALLLAVMIYILPSASYGWGYVQKQLRKQQDDVVLMLCA